MENKIYKTSSILLLAVAVVAAAWLVMGETQSTEKIIPSTGHATNQVVEQSQWLAGPVGGGQNNVPYLQCDTSTILEEESDTYGGYYNSPVGVPTSLTILPSTIDAIEAVINNYLADPTPSNYLAIPAWARDDVDTYLVYVGSAQDAALAECESKIDNAEVSCGPSQTCPNSECYDSYGVGSCALTTNDYAPVSFEVAETNANGEVVYAAIVKNIEVKATGSKTATCSGCA